jgi:hypothetical protein
MVVLQKGTKLIITLACLSLAYYALAEVYRVVDENGTVQYTDNPPSDDPTVEPVELPTINTQPGLQPVKTFTKQEAKEEDTGYQSIRISTPAQGTTTPPGQESIPVQVSLAPQLKDGDAIQLMFNGKLYVPASSSTSYNIGSLIRGEHKIQAQIIDSKGNVIARSGTTTVYVKRHSIKYNNN